MLDFVRVALGAAAIFLLPGYALLALARRQLDFDPVETLCMALGLSLAAVPLLLYATTLLGIQQGRWLVVGLLVLCAVVAVWGHWPGRSAVKSVGKPLDRAAYLAYGALAVIFLFTLVGRLWSVRGIAFPLWTDSYGHMLITQLVLDAGAVPATYEPYAPIHEFTYHFGFHTLTAWFHWITGTPLPRSLVLVGQILNALVVPVTYLFVKHLFNSRGAGVIAALIAGLLSHMPSQFVNWGRYTQLHGQMLLPVVLVLYLAFLRNPKPNVRVLLLTALAFAGLFFAHYRIFVFGMLFVIILFAFAYSWPQQWGQPRGRLLLNNLLIAGVGLLLLGPWLWRLAGGFGGNYARTVVDYQEEVHGEYFGFSLNEFVDYGMHGYLWVVAGLGALLGLWRRNRVVIALMLWMAAMLAGANLHLINFTPLYSTTIVILMIYLPVSALCGYVVVEGGKWIAAQTGLRLAFSPRLAAGLLAVLLLAGIYSVQRDQELVAPENGFVLPEDLAAMEWIRQEIPPDALFYIATSFWTPTVAHGLEAGYYLPLLAGRQTIMPLQNYASDGTMEYRSLVNQRLRDLAAAPDMHTLAQTMRAYGISHVYIGARPTHLNPQSFVDAPADFDLLYNEGGVWIFAVRPAALQGGAS